MKIDRPPSLVLTQALSRAARTAQFLAGQDLFLQGADADPLYVIMSGRVRLWRTLADGSAYTILILGSGETIGSIAVAQGGGQPASATAIDTVTVECLDAKLFRSELAGHADLAASFLKIVARRANQLIDRFGDVAGATVSVRLARALIRFSAAEGMQANHLDVLIPLRQQDLAEIAITTVPTISRQLSAWARDAIVEIHRGGVTIKDFAALGRVAGVQID